MSSAFWGRVAIILGSTCFGFLGPIGKWAEQLHIPLGTLLVYRFGIASIISLIILFLMQRKANSSLASASSTKLSLQRLLVYAGLGVFGYAVFSTLYFQAISKNSVTVAVMLLFTYPIWVQLLSHFFVARQGWRSWLVILVGFAGVMFLVGGQVSVQSAAGILFGLGAALSYAAYILVSARLDKNLNPLELSSFVMLFACLGLFVFHASEVMSPLSLNGLQWGLLFFIAVIVTIFPLTLVQVSLQRIPANEMALYSLFEPITAVTIAGIFFHESLNLQQMLGLILIAIAFLGNQLKKTTPEQVA